MRFVATGADIVLLRDTIKQYGLQSQVFKCQEELAELGLVLARGLLIGEPDYDALADEIADVYIMLHSMAYGFGVNERTDKRVEYKMGRLAHRVREKLPPIDKPVSL